METFEIQTTYTFFVEILTTRRDPLMELSIGCIKFVHLNKRTMLKPAAFLICLLLCFSGIKAQQSSITGRITDSTEKRNLSHAVISLLRHADSSLIQFTRSNAEGYFSLPKADTGRYLVLITYPKFADYLEQINLVADLDLKDIYLTPISRMLDEVVVRGGAAIRIKGDTTEFIADSFKTKEGATVEDLLKKLPGFTVNSKGEIVAQGKRVDKVLVDGEEFFGDDPTMATQNISAKAVDRVQVFETKSEQQQLTGVTTGNEGKTVNIKLKEDQKKGSFGKAYAGTDFDHFIDAKGLYNKFKGKRKISVYASRTNISTGSLNWKKNKSSVSRMTSNMMSSAGIISVLEEVMNLMITTCAGCRTLILPALFSPINGIPINTMSIPPTGLIVWVLQIRAVPLPRISFLPVSLIPIISVIKPG
ncbi:MAG TPA: TonB-dependent receptor [Chitinophagaceae bacterium]|nr:TonB-dependent receptor [Chitinophagaceae bacterium]